MNSNAQLVESLSRSAIYQDYERAFNESTGMPLSLRPVETWTLPLHRRARENPFCSMLAERNRTCAACLRMQASLAEKAREGPCTITCAYGLSETAVPVKCGAEVVGLLQTGQVASRKAGSAAFQRAVQAAAELGVDINSPEVRDAYLKTPVVSRRRLEALSTLLAIFADHLSMKCNQLAIRAANAEPPNVTTAKRFIREHHTEDLSLGQVAAAVHTSVFHFCKVFRKATGTTFTEFLSRTRVEAARNLLLNPNLRISEIAYEVGFQSLTHFNRVFRKIVGESPTAYRGHMPKLP